MYTSTGYFLEEVLTLIRVVLLGSAVCKKEAKTGGRRLMATNGSTMDIDGGKLTGLRMDHRNSVFNRSATNCFRGLFPPRNNPPPHARCVESSLLNHQLGRIRYDSASTSRGGSV
ncbi:predicted protein [Histoplasma capsulatum G186AR]|uniref:Uncharacterized protein n=1 Tax=Ajellomyces capsulatus (strain G186AR / H82 / ATCC MYA-2454 / RMSCC 2432) TaxID=447093 RepID=C0NU94_AJECG|nr:uncharacterized protein HCBG_06925 [Histoplasma capsulatum G186AR]EEH04974.1 predicted protein [Histoplasma capsulatum G186AR]